MWWVIFVTDVLVVILRILVTRVFTRGIALVRVELVIWFFVWAYEHTCVLAWHTEPVARRTGRVARD